MHRLHFSLDINAPRERVWKVLWVEETFRDWTSVFAEGTEGSYIKSNWEEGSRFEFFESNVGSYGVIEKLVPNESITFKHLGEIQNKEEYPFEKPRLERYMLRENDGVTTLALDQDIPEEHKSMFEEATPKAFERIKELVEK